MGTDTPGISEANHRGCHPDRNHPVVDWELAEPTDPARIHFDLDPVHDGQAWLNYIRTPALCGELGLCNPDNRSIWKRFLAANGLRLADLQDSIHFNKRGSDLWKEILRPYLGAARLNPPIDPFNNSRVRTYPVGVDGLSGSTDSCAFRLWVTGGGCCRGGRLGGRVG